MTNIYTVTLRTSEKTKIKVAASDENEAKKNAFSSYTFIGAMRCPNPKIDDVIESVELDPEGILRGTHLQPSVHNGRPPMTWREILKEQFS